MSDKWDKLNKELDDALDAEFGSEEPKQESVFENAKSTLRKHLFDNKEKVAKDLEQMREWSNTNKQETLEEAAENYAKQFDYAEDSSPQLDFIESAKWVQERSYSEEDLREAFRQGQDNVEYSEMYGFDSKLTEQEWFQQFKKK